MSGRTRKPSKRETKNDRPEKYNWNEKLLEGSKEFEREKQSESQRYDNKNIVQEDISYFCIAAKELYLHSQLQRVCAESQATVSGPIVEQYMCVTAHGNRRQEEEKE